MKTTILMSGVGGAGAIALLGALRDTNRYQLIGIDCDPYAVGSRLCDDFYVVPKAIEESYKSGLAEILRDERPEFLVPLVDEELLVMHELAKDYGMRVIAPQRAFCAMALDKYETTKQCQVAGIAVAETVLATGHEAISYPAVIKPRQGRGSRGLAYLDNDDELFAYTRRAERGPTQYVVQQRLMGTEYTVSVVVGLDGTVLAVVPKEVKAKRGITYVGVTRVNQAIDWLCRKIQAVLHADGPFNVQLMLSADGIPTVFEINPRLSTTTTLTLAAGINEVDVVIRQAEGESLDALRWMPDLLMVRSVTQSVMPESHWRTQGVGRG